MNAAEKNTLEIIRSEMLRVDGELAILRGHQRKMKKLVDEADEQIGIKFRLKEELEAKAHYL